MHTKPAAQVAAVYQRRIGDIVITALSDGYLDGSMEVLRNIKPEAATKILTDQFLPARRTHVNCFLVYSAGRLALIETGSGTYLGPTAGWLQKNLAAAGIALESIEAILLTHMHPDHSAGLTCRETGKPFFANAELIVHENEPKHWSDDAAMAKVSERQQRLYFIAGREQIAPYKSRMRLIQKGDVFPGITAIPCHGHTPGHTSYLIASGGEQVLIWGDTVHVPEVQTAHPEVGMEFDTDTDAGIATRRRVFDWVATDKLLVTGMHMPFPGFSHLVRAGAGYQLIPEPWQF